VAAGDSFATFTPTRAKKLAIIIGSQKAIGMAVRSVNQKQRYTQLQQRLAQVGLQM
jgi:exodeoxyribonuclease V alpha subunit